MLFHEVTLIEGDIRAWLKKHEVDKAQELEGTQSVWPADQEIAKEIWRSSIHGWSGLDVFTFCNMPSATDESAKTQSSEQEARIIFGR